MRIKLDKDVYGKKRFVDGGPNSDDLESIFSFDGVNLRNGVRARKKYRIDSNGNASKVQNTDLGMKANGNSVAVFVSEIPEKADPPGDGKS